MARCALSASPPTSTSAAASAVPARGSASVATVPTSAGPARKATLDAIDSSANAVGSSSLPASACDQRAATSAPICGIVAPASTASGSIGPPASSPAIARPCAVTNSGTTRVCPYRSMTRATCGPITASVTAKAPVTRPARP